MTKSHVERIKVTGRLLRLGMKHMEQATGVKLKLMHTSRSSKKYANSWLLYTEDKKGEMKHIADSTTLTGMFDIMVGINHFLLLMPGDRITINPEHLLT